MMNRSGEDNAAIKLLDTHKMTYKVQYPQHVKTFMISVGCL